MARTTRGPLNPRLLTAVPQSRAAVATLGAVGVVTGLLTVAQVVALAALVTDLVKGAPVMTPAVVVAFLFVARGALAGLGERVAATAATRVSGGLRRRLVERELSLQGTEADHGLSTLLAQGCSSIEGYVTRYLPTLVSAAVLPPVTLLVLAVVDPWSALVVVLTMPLLPLFAALIGRATQDATQRRWQALSDLSGHFADVLHGLPTLVSYGRGEAQAKAVRTVSERHRRATTRTLRIAFLSSTALEIVATISVALVAVIAGVRLAAGDLDLHTGLLAILLAPEAYWPVRRVGAEFHAAADGAQALDAVLGRLGRDDVITAPRRVGGPLVLDDVTFRYAGRPAPVLDHVTLTLAGGAGLTVVTGPSGAGKTTLLEVLAGVRHATSGAVDGPVAHLVAQCPFLLPGTVRSNLLLGACRRDPQPGTPQPGTPQPGTPQPGTPQPGTPQPGTPQLDAPQPDAPQPDASGADSRTLRSLRDDDLWSALRLVGLDTAVASHPEGLDAPVGDDGTGWSAGQRARLVLARAALSSAALLLLDEPTAHVDADTRERLDDVVARLSQTRCVVAVAHRAGLVDRADHLLRLGDGHVSTGELTLNATVPSTVTR